MAASYKIKLNDEVRSVLERCEFSPDSVKLPSQLDRRLYEQVNKVLASYGGKWNRGRGVHLFSQPPRELILGAVQSGEVVDARKVQQKFYTPDDLADRVAELACPSGLIVLEPSAGAGSLARAVLRAGARAVDCVEPYPDRESPLEAIDGVRGIYNVDFLTHPTDVLYSCIVMNPPFARGQATRHLERAMQCLRQDSSILVAILPDDRATANSVRELADANFGDCLVESHDVPAGAFRQSGTGVATKIWKIVSFG